MNVSSLAGNLGSFSTLLVSSFFGNIGTFSTLSVSSLIGYSPGGGGGTGSSTFSTLFTSTLSGNAIISNPQMLPYGFTSTLQLTSYTSPVILTSPFIAVQGIVVNTLNNNIYVVDNGNKRILTITPGGGVSILAGGGTDGATSGTTVTNTIGRNALFTSPIALTINSNNTVLYGTSYHIIYSITLATSNVMIIAGTNSTGSTDATGTNAQFNYPGHLAYNSNTNYLYVCDSGNCRIRSINLANSNVVTLAGSLTNARGYTNSIGTSALFNTPWGITIDSANSNLYVAEIDNYVVRKIVIATSNVTTFAGAGPLNVGYTNGIGTNATFNTPLHVVADSNNTIYVADKYNGMIRKITQDGTVTRLSGGGIQGGQYGYIDGVAGNAAFFGNIIQGLGIHPLTGMLYVPDFTNANVIRTIQTQNTSPLIVNPLLLNPLSGNVGINTANPQYTLDVNGTIYSSGDIIAFSDRRVKTNITTIDSGLTLVNALRGVYYNRTDTNEPTIRHMGVIAQEIEQVLPEVVKTDTSEQQMKSVAYGNIVAVLIEGIKELSQRLVPLETLSTQVATLQWQNMCLQSTVGSLMMR